MWVAPNAITGPDGQPVTLDERVVEVVHRVIFTLALAGWGGITGSGLGRSRFREEALG